MLSGHPQFSNSPNRLLRHKQIDSVKHSELWFAKKLFWQPTALTPLSRRSGQNQVSVVFTDNWVSIAKCSWSICWHLLAVECCVSAWLLGVHFDIPEWIRQHCVGVEHLKYYFNNSKFIDKMNFIIQNAK